MRVLAVVSGEWKVNYQLSEKKKIPNFLCDVGLGHFSTQKHNWEEAQIWLSRACQGSCHPTEYCKSASVVAWNKSPKWICSCEGVWQGQEATEGWMSASWTPFAVGSQLPGEDAGQARWQTLSCLISVRQTPWPSQRRRV